VNNLANKIQDTVRQTQARLGELQRDLMDKTKYAARSTDSYVHEKPWSAVCAAVSLGFVLGLIIGRR
jgi:ElaB protein